MPPIKGSGPNTRDARQVNVRLDDRMEAAVKTLKERQGLSDTAATRHLVTLGVAAMSTPTPLPPLTTEEYARRATGLMELLSDLLARVESHNPKGAVLLAGAVREAAVSYEKALKKRHAR
jgi:hypothetical protein